MALTASVWVAMTIPSGCHEQIVQRDGLDSVGQDISQVELRLDNPNEAGAEFARRPDNSKNLTVLTSRETVWRMTVTS